MKLTSPLSSTGSAAARKRAVNLTLNTALVAKARGLTDNLSGVVEGLLVWFVEHERETPRSREKSVQATVATWNEFNARRGSFADEYSTL